MIKAVFAGNFNTYSYKGFCQQSQFFFRRLRAVKPGESKYEIDLDSLQVTDNSVDAKLLNTEAGVLFKFSLTAINGNIFRIQVDEASPLYQRYRPQFALNGEPQVSK